MVASRSNDTGLLIKTARLERCLSQEDLASATGFAQNFISKLERGDRLPSAKVARVLASVLSLDAALLCPVLDPSYSVPQTGLAGRRGRAASDTGVVRGPLVSLRLDKQLAESLADEARRLGLVDGAGEPQLGWTIRTVLAKHFSPRGRRK